MIDFFLYFFILSIDYHSGNGNIEFGEVVSTLQKWLAGKDSLAELLEVINLWRG